MSAWLGAASAACAQTYDAKTDFSATQNPHGAWTYGWSADLAGPLTVYPDTFTKEGGYNWTDNRIDNLGDPNVAYVPPNDFQTDVPANTLAFHPGPENQFSHCRFTAPSAGVYNIQASFTSLSYGGPHVYLLRNGASIGDSLLTQGAPWAASFNSVSLAAGSTIDAVIGVGSDGFYANDEATFSLTITRAGAVASGSLTPGVFRALLTGSSGPGMIAGVLTASVQKTGDFTALLNVGGDRVSFKGRFNKAGLYSTLVKLKDGMQFAVSMSFDSHGNLMGTISNNNETLSFSGGKASGIGPARGIYTFTLSPSQSLGPGDAPEGTGFGYMDARPDGGVAVVGELADGTSFSTSSTITSGSLAPIYLNPYKSAGGEIAGTLVFQDVPDVSDCAGTLYWIRPATEAHSTYAQGFELSTQFQAAKFNPVIAGLEHDSVSVDANGADLHADFSGNVTLQLSSGGFIPLFAGNARNVHLAIVPIADAFFGSFEDGATHTLHSFDGVLLPKSRTGAGFFFSDGLSGSVNIEY